jgi:hypothetical protein
MAYAKGYAQKPADLLRQAAQKLADPSFDKLRMIGQFLSDPFAMARSGSQEDRLVSEQEQ